ncbi:hypothetical protein Ancab_020723 [Ancistrocladus abbreviatus]
MSTNVHQRMKVEDETLTWQGSTKQLTRPPGRRTDTFGTVGNRLLVEGQDGNFGKQWETPGNQTEANEDASNRSPSSKMADSASGGGEIVVTSQP